MDKEYLSAAQAAEYLGITRARINQLASGGKIQRDEVGGYFVYSRAELDRWKAAPKDLGGRPKSELLGAQINRGPDPPTGRQRRDLPPRHTPRLCPRPGAR